MRGASLFTAFCESIVDLFTHRLRGKRRRRRQQRLQRYSFAALFVVALTAHATSVTPPSFTELVAEAQVVARAAVTGISSRWVDSPRGPIIKTFVDFSIAKTIKGNPANPLTLEFLGGTVGSESMRVSGMPEFKVGETEILFVRDNGVQFCPLVRMMHGRYHVRAEATSKRKYVTRDDDTPVASTADVQLPAENHGGATLSPARSIATALSPDDFEADVQTEVKRQEAERTQQK